MMKRRGGREGKNEEEENLSIGTQWEQSPTNRRLTGKDCKEMPDGHDLGRSVGHPCGLIVALEIFSEAPILFWLIIRKATLTLLILSRYFNC